MPNLTGVSDEYRDSLVNWLRFNHRDIPNALIYLAMCLLLLALAWGGDTLASHSSRSTAPTRSSSAKPWPSATATS